MPSPRAPSPELPHVREQRPIVVLAPDGSLWFGDEFGPYLIHTDSSGRVLEAPIPLPNTGKTFAYIMDSASNAIGDFTALTDRQFLIIERDGGQGDASDPRFTSPARFKKIFRIDLGRIDASGNLVKEEVADLMNIYDPRDVAGDGRTKTVFTFPFVTIEDVLVLDNDRRKDDRGRDHDGRDGRGNDCRPASE